VAKHKPSVKSHGKAKSKKKSPAQSYDNMMGSPMDQADHPVTNMPAPQGGSLDGVAPPGLGSAMPPGMGM
jgi:hypothetical protein